MSCPLPTVFGGFACAPTYPTGLLGYPSAHAYVPSDFLTKHKVMDETKNFKMVLAGHPPGAGSS